MGSSDAIQKQWDIAATSFNSVEKLRELIGVASEDNVQPQALLAFCSLGTLVHPTSDLIGSAVDALGGTNNVKLEKFKLAIGLKQGGTAQYLRQSTPGVAAFLLLSALKMWCEDEDVGSILYRIALKSGVIDTLPASPQQFCDIVHAVSGHSRRIIPVNHMIHIGDTVLSAGIDASVMKVIYKEISNEAVANIFSSVLNGLHNSDVKRMSLIGAHAAMWLIGLLTWLFPDDVCVTAANVIVTGLHASRLVIDLRFSSNVFGWECLEWKEELPLRSLISMEDVTIHQMCVPRMITKHRLQCKYGLSDSQAAIIGRIAGTVLSHLVERATIYRVMPKTERTRRSFAEARLDEDELQGSPKKPPTIPLLEVAGTWFCEEYPTLMQHYGWSMDDLLSDQKELCDARRTWGNLSAASQPAITVFIDDHLVPSAVSLYSPFFYVPMLRVCMDSVVDVASDALVFISRDTASSWECTEALDRSTGTPPGSVVAEILTNIPITIRCLAEEIRRRLCWNWFDWNYQMPLTSRNGCVVCPSIILEPSLKQRSALALNIISGSIKRGVDRFSAVREIEDESNSSICSAGPVRLFAKGEFVRLIPFLAHQRVELEVLSSTSGTVLTIQSRLIFDMGTAIPSSNRLSKIKGTDQDYRIIKVFSWIQIAESLATAKHMRDDELITPREEEALARSLDSSQSQMLNLLQWILPYSGRSSRDPQGPDDKKLIARTCQDVMASFYQISQPNTLPVIQNGVSLVKCIAVAEEMADEWVIIT